MTPLTCFKMIFVVTLKSVKIKIQSSLSIYYNDQILLKYATSVLTS